MPQRAPVVQRLNGWEIKGPREICQSNSNERADGVPVLIKIHPQIKDQETCRLRIQITALAPQTLIINVYWYVDLMGWTQTLWRPAKLTHLKRKADNFTRVLEDVNTGIGFLRRKKGCVCKIVWSIWKVIWDSSQINIQFIIRTQQFHIQMLLSRKWNQGVLFLLAIYSKQQYSQLEGPSKHRWRSGD